MPHHLEHQVRRRPEIRSDRAQSPSAIPGQPQRPVADRTGAQQRRSLGVGEDVRDAIDEGCRRNHVLGIAAVCVSSRCPELRAQVLLARLAPVTFAAGRVDPGHTDPVAELEARSPARPEPRRARPPGDRARRAVPAAASAPRSRPAPCGTPRRRTPAAGPRPTLAAGSGGPPAARAGGYPGAPPEQARSSRGIENAPYGERRSILPACSPTRPRPCSSVHLPAARSARDPGCRIRPPADRTAAWPGAARPCLRLSQPARA